MARRTAQQLSVDELRTQISQRLRSNAAFSKTVYQDQPIIMTGSQLKSFVPDAIREARQLAKQGYARNLGVVDVFYEQARLLAGYEDDFEFTGTFSHYYPTYEDMSNEQLRGYFTWRTKVRQGTVEQGSISFAYVYLYEFINLVGVTSAREGYDAMLAFGTAYRRFDARFGRLFDTWLDDFVIYYGLDASLLRTRSFAKRDAAFDVLLHHESHTDGELFDALVTLGDYAIAESPFFVEHEAELRRLIAHAYRAAAQHHAKLKTTLPAKLAGRLRNERLWLFERAVFANPLNITNAEYQISPYDTVYCRGAAWFRTRYENLEYPIPWISQLLETCECALRDAYAYPNTLERKLTTKYLLKAIEAQAANLAEETRLREERAVHIDFSRLDRIRAAAEITCEKLIVEEESEISPLRGLTAAPVEMTGSTAHGPSVEMTMESEGADMSAPTVISSGANEAGTPPVISSEADDMSAPTVISSEADDMSAPAVISSGANEVSGVEKSPQHPLTPDEAAFLETLLADGSIRDFERAHACMASVLVDSINDKLYDEFADICIDTCTGEPVIIEDYVPELRDLLNLS